MEESMQIYNTLSRRKEVFIPLIANEVRMYVCGMTVYDHCHLGHARVMVVFDMVARYLRHLGYHVTYVRNITDIDDKIIQRAKREGISTEALTARYIQDMHEDEALLGVMTPDMEPRATHAIHEMLAMIGRLVDQGYAYQGSHGDVYFSVSSFGQYGRLSGKNLEDLRAGERVDVDASKRDPLDFVLWKHAKPDEPHWPSPWGDGRPGWHIECSAMSTCCLGEHFDIHGGGMDLQFPHHENEIAQSEAASGKTYVNYWMHNGFIRLNEEKMSKSLGNFFTLREVLQTCHPEVVRFFILNSHYRSPLNYSQDTIDEAAASLGRLYTALKDHPDVIPLNKGCMDPFMEKFEKAMQDDFNTPEAIAVMFELARAINRRKHDGETDDETRRLAAVLRHMGSLLGLLQSDPRSLLKAGLASSQTADSGVDSDWIESQIAARLEARNRRDWSASDQIRDALKARGIVLEDSAEGTTWRRG